MESQNEKGGPIAALVISSILPASAGESPATTHNAGYLPEAAPAAWGYIAAIFSSRAFCFCPSPGWRQRRMTFPSSVCMTQDART
jgi:hypothetical protein